MLRHIHGEICVEPQVALIKMTSVDLGLLLSGIPLCLLSRAANVFPLAYLLNKYRRFPIPFRVQTMQWACGLRGAVAYALAAFMTQLPKAQPSEPIETATLIIVVFSTICFGGLTGPLMRLMRLQVHSHDELMLLLFPSVFRFQSRCLIAGG